MLGSWITMAGSAGVGKSTLAALIGATLRRDGTMVDVFAEEQLFTRAEFAAVAEGFRSHSYACPETFENGYRAWLTGLRPDTVAVMDWNPAAMVGDLPWAMADEARIRGHLEAVRGLSGDRVGLLHLEAPAELSVQRAARQRGEEWLARADRIARSAGFDHPDRLCRIVAAAHEHIGRTERDVRSAAAAGWLVYRIDATIPIQEVAEHAISWIDRHRQQVRR